MITKRRTIKALRLARECIAREIQRFAVDANLYDRGLMITPHGADASKRRKDLMDAGAVIDDLIMKAQEAEGG